MASPSSTAKRESFAIARIPIEELAKHATFLEVSFLLIYGKLPNKEELADFSGSIGRHTMLHEDFKKIYAALPKDASPDGGLLGDGRCHGDFLSRFAGSA